MSCKIQVLPGKGYGLGNPQMTHEEPERMIKTHRGAVRRGRGTEDGVEGI
jgi:hypothetical protein